jgi:hypothetical protein
MHFIRITFLLIIVCVGTIQQVAAQNDPRWTKLPNYDNKTLHYGFSLGVNASGFKTHVSEKYFSDTIKSLKGVFSPGFSLGFLVNLKLHDQLDLRLMPTVGFYTRTIKYDFLYTQNEQNIESTFIEFPLLLKYKSVRRRNSRMYLVGGLKVGFEAGAKKRQRKISDLRTNGMDLTLEYGAGFDFYFEFYKFSPEIRFSHGIVDLLNADPNVYSTSLSKITSHTISIYLHFE